MKNIYLKLLLLPTLLASAAFLTTARADDKTDAAAAKQEQHAKNLAKYDTNKDGKLDDAEKAAMKADKEKAAKEHAEHAKK